MLNVLLVRIQPTDRLNDKRPDNYEYFSNKNALDFEISVSNGETLQLKASKEYYLVPGSWANKKSLFQEKVDAIDNELDTGYGGHVVAIDKYPASQFRNSAKIGEERNSGLTRYKIESRSNDFTYDAVVLLAPGSEPIILADLNFAADGISSKGYCPSFIVFKKEDVLSVKSPFGEVIGIALKHCNENALEPGSEILDYTMSFEKVSLPAVVLQKLLETKPQSEGEPHEETNE